MKIGNRDGEEYLRMPYPEAAQAELCEEICEKLSLFNALFPRETWVDEVKQKLWAAHAARWRTKGSA